MSGDIKKMITAELYSPTEPDKSQKERFVSFISKKYKTEAELNWIKDDSISSGFRLVVGKDVYDWTTEGRFTQLREMLQSINIESDASEKEFISLIKTSVQDWSLDAVAEGRYRGLHGIPARRNHRLDAIHHTGDPAA